MFAGLVIGCFVVGMISVGVIHHERRVYGVVPMIWIVGIGAFLGFLVGLPLMFWPSFEGCSTGEDIWISVGFYFRHAVEYRSGYLFFGILLGVLVSWLSLKMVGPYLFRNPNGPKK